MICANNECSAPLGSTPAQRRKTTFCRRCAARQTARDPKKRAKCKAAMEQHFASPIARQKSAEMARAHWDRRRSDAEAMDRARQIGMKLCEPSVRAKAVAASIESRMKWCPPEFRAEYHRMCRTHAMRADEAREVILATIKSDIAALHAGRIFPQKQFMRLRAAERWLSGERTAP